MAITLYYRNTATHVGSLGAGGNFDLESTTGTTATQAIGANTPRAYVYYSATTFPNKLDWETGNYTWYLDVTTANANTQLTSVKVSRYDSTLTTEKASGTSTTNLALSTTGLKSGSITFASPNPGGRAADDRLVLTLNITKLSGGGVQSTNNDVNGSADSRLDTPLIIPVVRDISESAVSVSESVTTTKLYSRPIAEPSISTSDSVASEYTSNASIFSVHCVEFPETTSDVVEISTEAIQPITTTKTHKFNITQKVTRTRTHKYNVEQQITKTKTHKYNVLQQIVQTQTHKFHLLQQITQTQTHKYNVLKQIPQTQTHKFNILKSIQVTKTHKFSLIQQITQTQTHKFNVIKQILQTQTHKYSFEGKLTIVKTHKYNVIGKLTVSKTHKFHVLQPITQVQTHKYNVIGKLISAKTHVFSVLAGLLRSKTHKYNVLNQVTKTRTHKFNVSSSIINVSTTKTHKFNVSSALTQVTKPRTHKFNIQILVQVTKTHAFSVIQAIVKTKTHKYNLAGVVTRTRTHKYNVDGVAQQVTSPKTHVFSVLARLTTTKTHKFSLLTAAIQTQTHKYHVIKQITQVQTHKFNVIGKLTVTKTHKYNVLIKVAPAITKTHRFALLVAAIQTQTHKYNIIGRIYKTKTHRYQMGGRLVVNKIHRFQVGSGVVFQELGGSTNAFIRFQDRVQIIDIIADLNNLAIANIEIPVARPPANTAIGVVGIAEYSSRLLTASAYRPRHRIASTLITPQVIDTIDNLAVAPYIGIELLPPEAYQLRADIQLKPLKVIQVQCLTQLKQDDKTKIRIASATMLQQTQESVIGSEAQLEITAFIRPVIAPEIMTRQKVKILKTLINLLSSDHLFQ